MSGVERLSAFYARVAARTGLLQTSTLEDVVRATLAELDALTGTKHADVTHVEWVQESRSFAALSDEDREIIRGLASAPITASDEWPTAKVAPATHFLEVTSVGVNGEPRLDLVCTAAPGALCRMRPTDDRETWSPTDDDLVDGACWAVEYVEAAGLSDCVAVAGKDVTLARIPITIAYDEGVTVTPIAPHPTLPIDVSATARRRQRIAVLGTDFDDARNEAAYLPPDADVLLLSASRGVDQGHRETADALLITPEALGVTPFSVERLLPSLKPMLATRKLPEATACGAA